MKHMYLSIFYSLKWWVCKFNTSWKLHYHTVHQFTSGELISQIRR